MADSLPLCCDAAGGIVLDGVKAIPRRWRPAFDPGKHASLS